MERVIGVLAMLARVAAACACLLGTPRCFAESAATPAASESSQRAKRGIAFGLRLGYGQPIGNSGEATKLSTSIKGMIPIWIDAGYRISPQFYVGAFFQYGLGFTPDTPGCGAGCTLSDIRFGLNGHYHFAWSEKMQPWVGIGVGLENVVSSSDGGSDNATLGGAITGNAVLRGVEFINVQGGLDIAGQTRFFSFGPFVALSVGQFSSADVGSSAVPLTYDLRKALHLWLIIGLRGQFQFGFP